MDQNLTWTLVEFDGDVNNQWKPQFNFENRWQMKEK